MNLQLIRKKKKLSQMQMAEKLNIAVSTYCQYETGERNIPAEIVDKISNILEIDIKDIFTPTKFTVSK